jgi:hypothetical protein
LQASKFVEEHPEWDGRGVVVAILDTGVDPAAVGLQTTPDGRPKIVDIVDASGSGDVHMVAERSGSRSTVDFAVTSAAAASGMGSPAKLMSGADRGVTRVVGATGRVLRLNPDWRNPSNLWKVGSKRVDELYAGALRSRLNSEAAADGKAQGGALLAQAEKKLAAWRTAMGETATDPKDVRDSGRRAELGELLAQVEVAKTGAAQLASTDPHSDVIDVVAWFDGKTWRAAIDSSRTGDMTAAPGLASFREEREYGTLDQRSQLSYALNTYDEGSIVSIVTDAGSHGSHVAGITAGWHPRSPERCGVAPGAQIVAVKIGDSRLGSMETNQGLMRGVRAVLENQCDLINLSYGEPAAWPLSGRLIEQVNHAVGTKGVIFVTSAGNAGPALSTVGAPAACSHSTIAIAAMVSSSMAKAGYGLEDGPALTNYSWSSRGPVMSGHLGVSVAAPGGALASVPTWNLADSMHMNGTSMSAPNACGCFALLLSAAKAAGLSYTPYSIRRCVENSASFVSGTNVWALGRGLLDVPRAWALIQAGAKRAEAEKLAQSSVAREQAGPDEAGSLSWVGIDAAASGHVGMAPSGSLPPWAVGVVGPSRIRISKSADTPTACLPLHGPLGSKRGEDWSLPDLKVSVDFQGAGAGSQGDMGIYWREEAQSATASTCRATINVSWHPGVHERARLFFHRNYALVASASWVSTGASAVVTSLGGGFNVRVDPTSLPPGVHYAEVRGYRVGPDGAPLVDENGPDFFLPITVVRTERPASKAGNCPPEYRFRSLPLGCQSHTSTNDEGAALATSASSSKMEPWSCSEELALDGAVYERRFLTVPAGTAWMEMKLTRVDESAEDTSAKIFILHCLQVQPHTSEKKTVKEIYARLRPGEEATLVMPVVAGLTVEAVAGQYWSSIGPTKVTVLARFLGATTPSTVSFSPAEGVARIIASADSHDVTIKPVAKLTKVRKAIPPSSAVVEPLGQRDYSEDASPLFRLRLEYPYTPQGAPGAVEKVRAAIGTIQGLLYESPHMYQGIVAVDTSFKPADSPGEQPAVAARAPGRCGVRGLLSGFSDAFGDELSLSCGRSYALVAQVVSADRSALEAFKGQPLSLTVPLAAPVTLTCHATMAAAQTRPTGAPFALRKLAKGLALSVFVAAPADASLPPRPCQLIGTVDLCDYTPSSDAPDGRCPGGEVELVYSVLAAGPPTSASTGASSSTKASSDPKTDGDLVHEAVRDASIQALSKLKGGAFDILFDTLAAESPEHLPLLSALLARRVADLSPATAKGIDTSDAVRALVSTAVESVELVVRPAELAVFFGRRIEPTEATAEEEAELGKKKEARQLLVDAYWAETKARMFLLPLVLHKGKYDRDATSPHASAFRAALRRLREWQDPSSGAFRLALLEETLLRGEPGKALKLVNTLLGASPSERNEVASLDTLRGLQSALLRALAEASSSKDAMQGWETLRSRAEGAMAACRSASEVIF